MGEIVKDLENGEYGKGGEQQSFTLKKATLYRKNILPVPNIRTNGTPYVKPSEQKTVDTPKDKSDDFKPLPEIDE